MIYPRSSTVSASSAHRTHPPRRRRVRKGSHSRAKRAAPAFLFAAVAHQVRFFSVLRPRGHSSCLLRSFLPCRAVFARPQLGDPPLSV